MGWNLATLATFSETDRTNNLDAMRLVGALLVVIGHAFVLTDHLPVPRLAGIPIQAIGVFVFFSISGYLIARSWHHDPALGPFLIKRALRIFPALAATVLITALVIGPAVSSLVPADYFTTPGAWSYLSSLSLVPQYELPGVFADNPLPTVNGSLWTLGLEFVCYLIVAVVGLVARRHAWAGFACLAVVAICLARLAPEPAAWARSFGETAIYFAVGTLIYWVGPERLLSLVTVAAIVPVWIVCGALWPDVGVVLSWLAIPVVSLAVGLRRTPVLRRAARFGDLSYGVYLWGYVVQQVVVQYFGALPIALNLAIVVPITAALALGSWHTIEKRALRLKPRAAAERRVLVVPGVWGPVGGTLL